MKDLLKEFEIEGKILSVEKYGNGHINKTFLVKTDKETYIFQFVNANVFKNINMLMHNIYSVTSHILAKGGKTLEIVKTKDGRLYSQFGSDYFRGYKYIQNSVCYEKLPSLEMVKEAARGFGEFHSLLADIDVTQIGDVIPDFHNTKKRYKDFEKIVKKNPVKRNDLCYDDILFLRSRHNDYSLLVNALEDGSISKSITHNDPKINNVVFDKKTNKVSCVLDLDTVMTGTFLYDFGDALRSLFTGDNEDTLDTSKLVCDLDIYEAYLDGYYSMMKDVINEKEIELLPYSILVIAEELAIRFLGDFINGDKYFGVEYPTHNLVRARTQIALAKDIIKHLDDLKEITNKIVKKYK